MEKRKFLCTVIGNVNWYSHYGKKKSIECLKKPKLGIQYDPAILLLCIHQKQPKTLTGKECMYPPCSLQHYLL